MDLPPRLCAILGQSVSDCIRLSDAKAQAEKVVAKRKELEELAALTVEERTAIARERASAMRLLNSSGKITAKELTYRRIAYKPDRV